MTVERETWPGRHHDSAAPLGRDVVVRVGPGGLHLELPGGDHRLLRYESLRQTRGNFGDAAQFEYGEPVTETLIVPDGGIAERMRVAAGDRGRFRRPAGTRRFWTVALALAAALIGAAVILYAIGIPALATAAARRVPLEWEQRMGDEIAAQAAPVAQRIDDPRLGSALARIRERLESGLPGDRGRFRVIVVDRPEVNAFATPGGNIVVLRGLIAASGSPEELAAVLAHEMQHVVRRHSLAALLKHASLGLLIGLVAGDPGPASVGLELARHLGELSYSRGAEIEADAGALRQLRAARIDPAGALAFMERLRADEGAVPAFLSTHPGSAERLVRMRSQLEREPPGRIEPLIAAEEWSAAVRGLK